MHAIYFHLGVGAAGGVREGGGVHRAGGGVRAGSKMRAFCSGRGKTCSCLHLWLLVKVVKQEVIFCTITSLPLLPLWESSDTRTVSPGEYRKVGTDAKVDGFFSFFVFGMIELIMALIREEIFSKDIAVYF